jgi:peptidoglycan/xylan/chitin deacetylase (PgdA/CDA1 family)
VTASRIVWRGPADPRQVALTFDDGPDALTPRYLELLASEAVSATFFVTGGFLERYPEAVEAYLDGGHQVASHGYSHKRFTRLRPGRLRDELIRTSRSLGPMPHGHWVRPPHGALGPLDVAMMLATGYTVAMWSLDSKDHDGAAPEVISARCGPDRVRPGEVLLFHEGQHETLAALPVVIDQLRRAGFAFVTMADLVRPDGDRATRRFTGRPTSG